MTHALEFEKVEKTEDRAVMSCLPEDQIIEEAKKQLNEAGKRIEAVLEYYI